MIENFPRFAANDNERSESINALLAQLAQNQEELREVKSALQALESECGITHGEQRVVSKEQYKALEAAGLRAKILENKQIGLYLSLQAETAANDNKMPLQIAA